MKNILCIQLLNHSHVFASENKCKIEMLKENSVSIPNEVLSSPTANTAQQYIWYPAIGDTTPKVRIETCRLLKRQCL